MAITFDKQTKFFHLTTKNTSYLFGIFDNNYLYSPYYGRRMREGTDLKRLWQKYPSGFSPNYEGAPNVDYALDLIPTEYPAYGGGDYRSPAVGVRFENGSRNVDFKYVSHTITDGNEELEGLPSLSGGDQTLEVLVRDEFSGVEAVLRYVVFEDIDVIARSAKIVNNSKGTIFVNRALSMSLDLPIGDYDMIGLYGTHIRERQIDRTALRHGIQSVGSRRGTSSHHHNPFISFVAKNTDEDHGDAYGCALIYSGNWIGLADVDPFGGARVQMGIHPADFSWKLNVGESFVTPEAVMTYTHEGMNKMSQNFHNAFRYHLGHTKKRNVRRPIVVNNWEATYFDFDEEKLLGIIESCKGLGIDTFVLDDGWFGHRDTDNSSLGDWFVHTGKLPNGLTPLIEKCEEQGMTFGLWFEPEMISEDSDLYRAHPDWCLHVDGRPRTEARHQLILDMGRREVQDYVINAVGSVLRSAPISYVKWDMNRNMAEGFSCVLPAEQRMESQHRYMLGLYRVLVEITSQFPDVLFESCSGGGGRFDCGMLHYMPQTWTSDDSDACERVYIQYGTSLIYPCSSMGAHVSAVPNHQTCRVTPFQTRCDVAMGGNFGFELDLSKQSEEDLATAKKAIETVKKLRVTMQQGTYTRLLNPFENEGRAAWQFADDERVIVCIYNQRNQPNEQPHRVKLSGLEPAAIYEDLEHGIRASGAALMNMGLIMPWAWGDHNTWVYHFEKK